MTLNPAKSHNLPVYPSFGAGPGSAAPPGAAAASEAARSAQATPARPQAGRGPSTAGVPASGRGSSWANLVKTPAPAAPVPAAAPPAATPPSEKSTPSSPVKPAPLPAAPPVHESAAPARPPPPAATAVAPPPVQVPPTATATAAPPQAAKRYASALTSCMPPSGSRSTSAADGATRSPHPPQAAAGAPRSAPRSAPESPPAVPRPAHASGHPDGRKHAPAPPGARPPQRGPAPVVAPPANTESVLSTEVVAQVPSPRTRSASSISHSIAQAPQATPVSVAPMPAQHPVAARPPIQHGYPQGMYGPQGAAGYSRPMQPQHGGPVPVQPQQFMYVPLATPGGRPMMNQWTVPYGAAQPRPAAEFTGRPPIRGGGGGRGAGQAAMGPPSSHPVATNERSASSISTSSQSRAAETHKLSIRRKGAGAAAAGRGESGRSASEVSQPGDAKKSDSPVPMVRPQIPSVISHPASLPCLHLPSALHRSLVARLCVTRLQRYCCLHHLRALLPVNIQHCQIG